jgi:hypothetical protein
VLDMSRNLGIISHIDTGNYLKIGANSSGLLLFPTAGALSHPQMHPC